jgi:hypothetical protein
VIFERSEIVTPSTLLRGSCLVTVSTAIVFSKLTYSIRTISPIQLFSYERRKHMVYMPY